MDTKVARSEQPAGCSACGMAIHDHWFTVRDDGVVVACSHDEDGLTMICCDRVLEKLTDELLAYRREQGHAF